MKRALQLTFFISIFIVIYFGMHYYVISQYFYLLGISQGIWFYLTLLVLSSSFIVGMVLERKIPNFLTRWIYLLASVWMGVLFISLWTFAIYDLASLFLSSYMFFIRYYILAFILIVSMYALWNGQQIKVKKIKVYMPGLKKRIQAVQLTDLHIGTIRSSSFLKKVVSITNALKPDMIFITGDLFDGSAPLTKEIIAPINKLKSKTFFTIGNHEIYDGLEGVIKILKTTKLKVLRNMKTDYKGIEIIGVDFSENKKYLGDILPKLNLVGKKPRLLMYHPPANLDYINDYNISLQLSGHTHAGQIFPFNLFVRLAFPYVSGFYKKEEAQIYVSPGTGTWGPPMRLGSRSEITFIELLPK